MSSGFMAKRSERIKNKRAEIPPFFIIDIEYHERLFMLSLDHYSHRYQALHSYLTAKTGLMGGISGFYLHQHHRADEEVLVANEAE